ncbi:uncharacterized protein LOC143081639 [Mytilus galloprovincialis]|uniref:uncharacterized protein LOC143081639 n=1 Tax=Mytilus galloprovincialis TaxID=29158 RepID=UPI003F7BBEC7
MAEEVLKIVSVFILWIFVIAGHFICVFKNFTVYNDVILKTMIKMFLVSQLICSLWNLTGFLISTIAGGWILGDFMCQTFGFLNLILTSGNIWVMAIVSIERYHRFLAVLDHPSTFSPRNVNIIVCGIYILVVLLSSGPLYGLGEYSYFRGHINLTVTINMYSNNQTTIESNPDMTSYYLATFQKAVMQGKEHDPKTLISNHFLSDMGVSARVIVSSVISIIVRAFNIESIQAFWTNYNDGSVKQLLRSLLWKPYLGHTIGATSMGITTHADENQYYLYANVYLESQEIGMCSVDFTSYNSHAIIWSGYQLVISTFIPYVIIFVCYVTVYAKNPRSAMVLDKNVNEDDIFVLNWFSSASILCLVVTFIYYLVILINANGIFVSSDALFAISFIFYGNGLFCLISLFITNRCQCHRIQTKCRLFCYCSDEGSAYELSDLSLRNETMEILSQSSARHPSYV